MYKYREIINDPIKLHASLKEAWQKIDKFGEGYVTIEKLEIALRLFAFEMGLPSDLEPSPLERAIYKEQIDPYHTGEVDFEGYCMLIQLGIAKLRREGRI